MRIGFDTSEVLAYHTSATTYLLELIPELLAQAEEDDRIVLLPTRESASSPLAQLVRDPRFLLVDAPLGSGALGRLWRRLRFPAAERFPSAAAGADLGVAHCWKLPALPTCAQRRILTLHRAPDAGEKPSRLRRLARRFDRIVVTSALLLESFLERLDGRDADREHWRQRSVVIPPGLHDRYRQPPRPSSVEQLCEMHPLLEEPYILALGGAADPGGNLPLVVQAYARAGEEDGELPPLVVVAQPRSSAGTDQAIRRSGLDGRFLLLEDVRTELMPALYRGAEMLLYPSVDGAYGIAVIEAAAAGVPSVVGPRCGALDRLGDLLPIAALDEPEVWAERLLELHHDSPRRRDLGEAAQRRVADLSWEETARRHWELYRTAT